MCYAALAVARLRDGVARLHDAAMDKIDLVTPLYLLMHRDMPRAPRVRAFADFVAAEINGFRRLVSGWLSEVTDGGPRTSQ